MRFLLDACVASRRLAATLTELGHDVLCASDFNPSARDEELLQLAIEEQRIIITQDKDFGELVFLRGLSHSCIVRFVDMPVSDQVAALLELTAHHSQSMVDGVLIVVTRARIRVRSSRERD